MGGHDWYWDVNGSFGVNKAQQSFTGNVRADRVAQAIGPIANCTAPCVPLEPVRRRGLDHAGDAGLHRVHRARQEQPASVATYTANVSGDRGRPAGRPARRRGRCRASPPERASRRTRSFRPASAPTFRRSRRPATLMSNEIYGEVRVPILKDVPGSYSLEANGAVRYSHYSTSRREARPTRSTACGSRSTTCCSAAPTRPGSARRASASCSAAGRASTFRSSIRAPATSSGLFTDRRDGPRQLHRQRRSAPRRQLCRSQPGQLPVITQGNPQPEAGDVEELQPRRGLLAEPGAEWLRQCAQHRGRLSRHQGQECDQRARSQRDAQAIARWPAIRPAAPS